MKIIPIQSKNLILLLEKKQLPTTIPLIKNNLYTFIHQNYLYGIYKVIHTGKFHYLKKNHYRPFRLIGSSERIQSLLFDESKLKNLLRKDNLVKKELFIADSKEFSYLSFTSKLLPSLTYIHSINLDNDLEIIREEVKKYLANPQFNNLTTLKKIGKKLFSYLIPPTIEEILPKINSVTLFLNHIDFPLQICYDGNTFPFVQKMGYHHFFSSLSTFQTSKANKKSKQSLNSFHLVTSGEDDSMQEEKKQIQEIFKLKPYFDKKITTSTPKTIYSDIALSLEKSDMTHIITHGAIGGIKSVDRNIQKEKNNFNFSFTYQKEKIFDLNDFKKLQNVPRVLFLSCCYSNQRSLIESFFNAGGQSLIVVEGELISQNISSVLRIFYWQLLVRKKTVRDAFQSLLNTLLYQEDINAFKLKLYGKGTEKLHSF